MRAEVEFRPQSDIAREMIAWYDALYSASSTIDAYRIRRDPVLVTVQEKTAYIWKIILTMSKSQADAVLKQLTSDNKKRNN